MPVNQWNHLLNLSQPYKKNPRAMASIKKATPSNEKGMPNIGPACSMNFGHSKPNSNESIVPDTAPVAKNMATPLLQACVMCLYKGFLVFMYL